MTWTYSSTSITTDLAKVRLLVGLTDTSDQLMTDEEIQFYIDTEANIYSAAAKCANALASQFARQVDKEMGDLKLLASQKSRMFLKLSDVLTARGAMSGVPTSGGISIAERDALSSGADKIGPAVLRGIHDNV